jgi:hypothetical protein
VPKYRIFPGNIAAVCYVQPVDAAAEASTLTGRLPTATQLIYMSDVIGVVRCDGLKDKPMADLFPPEVQKSVNAHFATVFHLPVEARGAYLDNLQPWEVEVQS